jgi:YD repeat-containing protein
MAVLPNADMPSAGHFVKMCMVGRTNELGQNVKTAFDGLGRPTTITDPAGVEMTITYDGLSRETGRKITAPGSKPKIFNQISVTFKDDKQQSTPFSTNSRGRRLSPRQTFANGQLERKLRKKFSHSPTTKEIPIIKNNSFKSYRTKDLHISLPMTTVAISLALP